VSKWESVSTLDPNDFFTVDPLTNYLRMPYGMGLARLNLSNDLVFIYDFKRQGGATHYQKVVIPEPPGESIKKCWNPKCNNQVDHDVQKYCDDHGGLIPY